MKLLQVTNLCLLLSSLHSSEGNGTTFSFPSDDNQNKIMSTLRSSQTAGTETSTPIQVTMSPPNITTLIAGTSPKVGTTDKGSLQTNQPTLPITVKAEGATTIDTMKKNLTNISTTVSPLPRTISTSQSSQKSSKSPSSISTTQITVSTSEPGASISKTISTIPGSTSPSGGTENAKMPSPSSSTNPSHSNIILPVVIALIVITLSVFALVGLYRICRKTDPGTPENGNDQPQSDKESVKLLTVKTISHESGEHSAQGKIKN